MTVKSSVVSSQKTMIATIEVEFTARIRERLSLFRLMALTVLCASMVPPPDAGYAILHISGRAPMMSACTALQAAGVVLGMIALFVFGLMLDVGWRRDQRQQLQGLFVTQPTNTQGIVLGRLFANLAYAHCMIAIAAIAISSTLFARYGTLPTLEAFVLFAYIVMPAVITAAIIGMLIDLLLPEKAWLRLMIVFSAFLMIVMMASFGSVDIVGVTVLKQLIGDADTPHELALGFIRTDASTRFIWLELAAPLQGIFMQRSGLLLVLLGVAMFFAMLLAPLLARVSIQTAKQKQSSTQEIAVVRGESMDCQMLGGGPPFFGKVLAMIFVRIACRSKLAIWMLVTAFIIGLVDSSSGLSLTLVLFVPFMLLAGTPPEELRVAASIERCEPALSRLGPQLTVFSVIFLPMLVASAPALLQLDLQQAITALFGAAALTAWLIWSHRIHDFPVFGVSLAGIVLYANAFNNIPPAADVLGLWNSDPIALVISALMAVSAIAMLIPWRLR